MHRINRDLRVLEFYFLSMILNLAGGVLSQALRSRKRSIAIFLSSCAQLIPSQRKRLKRFALSGIFRGPRIDHWYGVTRSLHFRFIAVLESNPVPTAIKLREVGRIAAL